MPLYFFYTMVQKKSKMSKNSNQEGDPDLSPFLLARTFVLNSPSAPKATFESIDISTSIALVCSGNFDKRKNFSS